MTSTNTPQGWLCPACSKAHGPHVTTCPDAQVAAPRLYITWNDAGSIGPKYNWKNGSMTLMDVAPASSDNTP
jgi:hypothetical protein